MQFYINADLDAAILMQWVPGARVGVMQKAACCQTTSSAGENRRVSK